MPEPAEIITYLEKVRAGTLSRFEGLTQEQLNWVPPASPNDNGELSWSLGEVFMHLAIDGWLADANPTLRHTGGLEPMNGADWLKGYGGHESFHHRQIDALLAAMAQLTESNLA